MIDFDLHTSAKLAVIWIILNGYYVVDLIFVKRPKGWGVDRGCNWSSSITFVWPISVKLCRVIIQRIRNKFIGKVLYWRRYFDEAINFLKYGCGKNNFLSFTILHIIKEKIPPKILIFGLSTANRCKMLWDRVKNKL